MYSRFVYLFKLSNSFLIARRYFVTNGFDGVLAMLGLMMGFYGSEAASYQLILGACMGTAVALFMSGLTSAYISESAERKKELRDLEQSMIKSLDNSAHADATSFVPWIIALVNGLSPFIFALIILIPIFLGANGMDLVINPLEASLLMALLLTFLLGVFLGKLSGQFWLWTGARALLIAVVTAIIISLIN